jgi:N-methylhydantoinase A/oxoprolinase/acetone carboxylase beta subunit
VAAVADDADAVHLAIDVGGTFTDVVAASRMGVAAIKVPSQHGDPVAAVRRARIRERGDNYDRGEVDS